MDISLKWKLIILGSDISAPSDISFSYLFLKYETIISKGVVQNDTAF